MVESGYNLKDRLMNSAMHFRDNIAFESRLYSENKSLSYSDFLEKVQKTACFLNMHGVNKGDRVAIILENSVEWGIIFFALSYIGAVAVPLDIRFSEKDIENILSDSESDFVFASNDISLLDILGRLHSIRHIFIIEGDINNDRFISFKSDEMDSFSATISSEVFPEDIMLILYTSGTTDKPKGVMLTHRNLCSNFDSLKKLGLFSYRDVFLSILPLYHTYPLMTTLIVPVLSGAKVVYVSPDWPDKLSEYIRLSGITIFIGVPQIFHNMHARIMKKIEGLPYFSRIFVRLVMSLYAGNLFLPKFKGLFGRDFRFFVSGGARLDDRVERDFLKMGFGILQGYGLTETSPVVTFNFSDRRNIGSVGKPLPDVSVKLFDLDGQGIGEIGVKGPNVMKGYYKNIEKTQKVMREGWFMTGDLGYIDKMGYLYITGRSKEIIVLSSGKNIYPAEVEVYYSSVPYVKELCVLGVVKGKTEYLHAVIVPDFKLFKERGEIDIRKTLKDNIEILSKNIPGHKRIMGFTISQEELPRTVLGKIKRYEVEKRFIPFILQDKKDKKDKDKGVDLYLNDISTRLIRCIKDTFNLKNAVSLSDSIELDLGIDSLGRVELSCSIEKYFGVKLPGELIGVELITVGDLSLKIEEALEGKDGGHITSKGQTPILWRDILKEDISEDLKKKILLNPNFFDNALSFFIKGLMCLLFRIFFNLKINRSAPLTTKGPCIICVNHTSFLDGFIIAAAVPHKILANLFFIGFKKYFTFPVIRCFVNRARIIPIDANQIIEAIQASCFVLKHSKVLCVFPEGSRSIDGKLKDFKKGVGIISKELNIPLVPVSISGAFEAWPRTRVLPRPHKIAVRFGRAFYPEELIQKGIKFGADDDYEAVCLGIKEELINLT